MNNPEAIPALDRRIIDSGQIVWIDTRGSVFMTDYVGQVWRLWRG
jgi:hypothetical protein